MRFAQVHFLYLLLLLPFVFLLFFLAHRKRQGMIQKLGVPETLDKFSKRELKGTLRREGLYACLALFFFILALSKPQAGTRLEPVKITGSDIYIAIDLSLSMSAEDIKPNRLERAKIDALELVQSLRGDRAGLIFFAGDAFVQCPLTTDYSAITTVINALNPDTTVSSGTSLSAPLVIAMKSMKPEKDKYSVLLLLTDGEDTTEARGGSEASKASKASEASTANGDLEKTMKKVRKRGIKIFSIGIGTKEGAPLPVYDESGRRTGYKKDQYGKVVISALDEDNLKGISESTNGYYFKAGNTHDAVRKFLSTLNTLEKREIETKKYTVYEERYQIPLGTGILFLLLYLLTVMKVKKAG